MELGKHAAFILAAYGVVFTVVAGLLVWLVHDGRRQRAALADLERRGVRRRSAGASSSEGTA